MKTRALILGLSAFIGITSSSYALLSGNRLGIQMDTAQARSVVLDPMVASASGVVEPFSEERSLAATMIGTITYIGANEGDHVKAGQVIAEIDNSELKARLTAAQAGVAVRMSQLERLRNGAREEERKEAAANVAEADVAVRLAKSTLDRRSSLARTGVSSQSALDQARADYDGAVARRDLMAARQRLLEAPPREEDVKVASANVASAEAEVAVLEAQIEKSRLRSPVDGVLLRRFKSLGDTVSVLPPTLIATVGDVSRLRIRAYVDEADVARVAVGQKVLVTADAYGNQEFSGHVARVGDSLGPKRVRTDAATEKADTQVLDVLIDLDPSARLPVGLRVDVVFLPASQGAAPAPYAPAASS